MDWYDALWGGNIAFRLTAYFIALTCLLKLKNVIRYHVREYDNRKTGQPGRKEKEVKQEVTDNPVINDVVSALVNLGFPKKAAMVPAQYYYKQGKEDFDSLLRACLKSLS